MANRGRLARKSSFKNERQTQKWFYEIEMLLGKTGQKKSELVHHIFQNNILNVLVGKWKTENQKFNQLVDLADSLSFDEKQ